MIFAVPSIPDVGIKSIATTSETLTQVSQETSLLRLISDNWFQAKLFDFRVHGIWSYHENVVVAALN